MRIVDVEPVIRDLTAMKTEFGFDALLIDAMIEGLESQPVVGTDDTLRNKWISVKEWLPETAKIYNKRSSEEFRLSNPVLAFGKKGFAVAMVLRDEHQESFIDLDGYHISDITHWMPLPEPPEVDNS